jgi:charged multivesicular body protein 1
MDSFEKQFENLDVQAEFVSTAMGNTTAMSTPQEDVDLLMQQVADEHNISLVYDMPIAGSVLPAAAPAVPTQPTAVPVAVDADPEEDELSRRLAELKVL